MTLFLHVLMLFLLSGGSAKVVQNFEKECGQFFANGKSPTTFIGSQYRQICQTLNGVVYYATYYDTDNKIPVYSAYRFAGLMGCTRKSNWYIEPQLDNKILGENMASEGSVKDKNLRGVHQALNEDYEKSGFDRGHLAPVYLAESQSCADATFTLTNAAPQDRCFNRIFWWDVEEELAETLEKNCKSHSVYIVTGVVPGTVIINNRVKVPSHFWTAFCCLDQNSKCSYSGGVIGSNDSYNNIKSMTLAKFEENLKKLYGTTTFKVFQY
ncbi:hypothetical protein ABG768_000186 [Culter alburnus]|uniref:Endonuclease domain-containing 1 protein-like n=1 Tax=Culter alburnus TaxID=194366 RepID=A0AAW2B586_CULAL